MKPGRSPAGQLSALALMVMAITSPLLASAQLSSSREVMPNEHVSGRDEPWAESVATLPPFPREENLQEFYVSATTSHLYRLDLGSLTAGTDGVIRYALVVRTSGGATNITYEGIRCKHLLWKNYATGRNDGTWVLMRQSEWRPIESKTINRHQAALARDYFCPGGIPIASAEEGRDALRRGKHPNAL